MPPPPREGVFRPPPPRPPPTRPHTTQRPPYQPGIRSRRHTTHQPARDRCNGTSLYTVYMPHGVPTGRRLGDARHPQTRAIAIWRRATAAIVHEPNTGRRSTATYGDKKETPPLCARAGRAGGRPSQPPHTSNKEPPPPPAAPPPPPRHCVGPNFRHHKARVQAVGWFPLGARKQGSRPFADPTPPLTELGRDQKQTRHPLPQHALAPSLQAGTS